MSTYVGKFCDAKQSQVDIKQFDFIPFRYNLQPVQVHTSQCSAYQTQNVSNLLALAVIGRQCTPVASHNVLGNKGTWGAKTQIRGAIRYGTIHIIAVKHGVC